jgi:phosphatidylglycerophosphate synthase
VLTAPSCEPDASNLRTEDDGSVVEGMTGVGGRHWPLALGVAGLSLVLAVLESTSGLGAAGWLVGLGCGAALYAAVAAVAARSPRGLGPADMITLIRTTLSCGAAALVADSLVHPRPTSPLLVLAVTALALDLLDGWVARRTGTTSAFGARFDGEADAFLMLVLSVNVAASFGPWVVAIGAVRYLFGAAGFVLPWMRMRLPTRYWRKVVTATSGIVLVAAASRLLPDGVTLAALLLVLVLLAESFGRDVWWLVRHRAVARTGSAGPDGPDAVRVDA